MKASLLNRVLLAGAAITLIPAVSAQEDVKERAEKLAEQAQDVQREAGALANEVSEEREEARVDAADRTGANVNKAADRDDDGDEGKWGLLGLLGLAGLLGLRRREPDQKTEVRRDTHL
ncbi:WGxxGxxG family protein [Sphingomonas sp.]|jgi:MYXO-CTERM domain-containing protein|uniref:WGxxGxxG family protein n=1 Tax=Sphingomonas sp. TaxID=28214 RepID=UPI002ED774AA